ncbi:MAG: hypothetical protein CMF62_02145 [Magnetococcales bacterium]|nr:hypothetical protein [Magnetococcales bacterium]
MFNKLKGGKLLGQGSYGNIFGEPRLLCKDETLKDEMHSEVSKIFNNDRDAYDEYKVILRLKKYFTTEYDISRLNKFFLLPKKICLINKRSLDNLPYNQMRYIKNNLGQVSKLKPHSRYNQVIYDKADNDLSIKFRTTNTRLKLVECLVNLYDIGQGIKTLHDLDMVHLDIKAKNSVEINGKYKIIDVGDINKISNIDINKIKYWACSYTPFPSSIFMISELLYSSINVTSRNILMNYYEYSRFHNINLQYFYDTMKDYIAYDNKSFSDDQQQYLKKQFLKLISEKIFGAEIKEDVVFNSISIRNIYELKIFPLLNRMNRDFLSYPNKESIKKDILKRVDVYSFGIMIIMLVGNYLKKKRDIMTSSIKNLIFEMYKLAFLACEYNKYGVDINTILSKYENIMLDFKKENTIGLINISIPDSLLQPIPITSTIGNSITSGTVTSDTIASSAVASSAVASSAVASSAIASGAGATGSDFYIKSPPGNYYTEQQKKDDSWL